MIWKDVALTVVCMSFMALAVFSAFYIQTHPQTEMQMKMCNQDPVSYGGMCLNYSELKTEWAISNNTNITPNFGNCSLFDEHETKTIMHDYGKWGGMQPVTCYRCKGSNSDWMCPV